MASPGDRGPRVGDDIDWSAIWAASGAARLTGRSDGPPLDVPLGLVRLATDLAHRIGEASERLGRAVLLDGPALLAERSAITGWVRSGDVSCGGASRLLRTADGWLALSLARDDDVSAIPAWLEAFVPGDDPWPAVAEMVARRGTAELVDRGVLLGLPIGAVGAVHPGPGSSPSTHHRVGGAARPVRLEDLIVVDLSSLWAGPLCAHVLGLAGVRVVKVESAARPDAARDGAAAFYDLLHGGHESVCLDFHDPSDLGALRRLLERADVVIEASRPRALAQLGLDRGTVDGPKVWVSITAHGRVGRAGTRIGFGDDAAATGGLVVSDEHGPVFCVDAVADPLTGLAAAAAVLDRLDSGGRWHVDLALSRTAALATSGPPTDLGGRVLAPPRARRGVSAGTVLGRDTDAVLTELA